MLDKRNTQLIPNLLGRKVDHRVVEMVEKAYSGEMKFPELAEDLFMTARWKISHTTDVIFWVARVLPDDAALWAEALMVEYRKVGNRNDAYLHAILIGLFQISAALKDIPSRSTEDGRAFQEKFPDWFAELLVKGEVVALDSAHENALSKALDRYLQHDSAPGYTICDTMQKFAPNLHKYRWENNSVSEYILRRIGARLMERRLDRYEITNLLARYRDAQK